jgi:hypothetical protein
MNNAIKHQPYKHKIKASASGHNIENEKGPHSHTYKKKQEKSQNH